VNTLSPTIARTGAAPNRRSRSRLVLALLLATGACRGEKEQTLPIETAAVTRRTIVSEATASGQVEPINVIEVKSKSSGQITEMTVETGSLVTRGQLLIQLDPRDVQQQLSQAVADSVAASAKLAVSKAQKDRNDKMFADKIITAQEYEASQLDYANSVASMIRSRSAVDIAAQRVEEARVSAPVGGTIIEKPVSLGQVIASATNSASGGTILLKMADLTRVRVRALFNETDIGAVVPGQPATVTVDAFPDRPFGGTVEKIEPSAVIQSSVTMFPVLVTLDNREGLLKPGMNGEVMVLVERREDVLAVPNDAVRTTREAAATARLIGLDPDSVSAAVQEQMRSLGGGAGGNGGGGANGRSSRGDVDLTVLQGGERQGGRQGGNFQMPEVTDAQCTQVRDAMAKSPDVQTTLQGLRARVQNGEIDQQRSRAISDSIYKGLGVDAMVARACQFRGRQGGGRAGGDQGAGGTQTAQNGNEGGSNTGGGRRGGRRGNNAAAMMAGLDVPTSQASPRRVQARPALVYVAAGTSFVPRVVRVGMSDLDYTEIVSGLQEGENVLLMTALAMQASRDSAMQRMRARSGGMPGAPGGGGPGGPGGPGGGGGRGRGQ
jgi:HlyD family secretion protein